MDASEKARLREEAIRARYPNGVVVQLCQYETCVNEATRNGADEHGNPALVCDVHADVGRLARNPLQL